MKEHQSKPWYKKWWVWVIVVVVLIGLGGAAGNKSNTENVTNSNSDKTSTSNSSSSSTETAKEKMTIKNSTVTDKGYGMNQVDGEITNNDSGKHSATLKATFYAADGKIMGTATGAVNDVAPGETKTFSLMTTDSISGYANMKVQVDTLL